MRSNNRNGKNRVRLENGDESPHSKGASRRGASPKATHSKGASRRGRLMPPRGRILNYKQPLPPLAAAPRSEPTVSNLLRSFETVARSAERYCSGCGPHSRTLHFAVLRAAPARSSALRPAFRRWTASGKLPVATAASRLFFFYLFFEVVCSFLFIFLRGKRSVPLPLAPLFRHLPPSLSPPPPVHPPHTVFHT